ncbi:DUF7146 domain-containing protein [Thalassococcus profundi]|uniref:DUF7146 domain-containing protein n=1 Tax=Thalassococcus profundi TaxID=2282382 RepID=UPI004057CDE0
MTVQNQTLDFNGTPPGSRARAATRMSVAQLADMLENRIADLARELLGEPNRELSSAQTLRFGTKGSVAVEIDGANKGRWFDHEHGAGGAGLELIGYRLRLDDKAAWDWARNWLGEPEAGQSWTATPPESPARSASGSARPKEPTPEERAEKVAEIVRRSESLVSTPVLAYLRHRGITATPPDCIRYRQYAYRQFGAMVALATDEAGEVLALQQVYLTAEGRKAPVKVVKRTNKAVEGWAERAAVRLPGREPLILCEGVETALSVWQATGQETWACLGISNIGRAPVPANATVVIARDGDLPGSKAEGQMARAASQLAHRGMTVLIATPPEEQDFNDVLVREGEAAVRNRIAAAEPFRVEEADTGRKRLFIGSDVEIAKRVREDLTERHGRIVHADGEF